MSAIPFIGRSRTATQTRTEWFEELASRVYEVLEAYYDGNDLYSDIQAAMWERAEWMEGLRGLRNPANRCVEFYASNLWPGALPGPRDELPPNIPDALPIVSTNEALKPAVRQIWQWSNWSSQKQVAARWLATYGDMFIKVVGTDADMREDGPRVFFQLINAKYVIDFETDERGYLTFIRIDIPERERTDRRTVLWTITEVWEKNSEEFGIGNGRYRRYRHQKAESAEITDLGRPEVDVPMRSAFGVDFVPIVHAKFRDVGDINGRGRAAFYHVLDKIDEANRQATRLHQMLFRNNNALWALQANAQTPDGRPLPPPAISVDGAIATEEIPMGDDRIIGIPGYGELKPLVPDLDYAGALAILMSHMDEIERDLPELAYYKLRDMGQISGIAVRMLLTDAIDRLLEARGNAESALIRADQMAITIGQNVGLFADVGTFESGNLDHMFEPRDVIEMTATEEAQQEQMEVTTLTLKKELGVPRSRLLLELGYEKSDIPVMMSEADAEATAEAERTASRFDAGQAFGGEP